MARRPEVDEQKSRSSKQPKHPKTRPRLPDLEFSKTAAMNILTRVDGKRGYGHAIDEFVDWYCSEHATGPEPNSATSSLIVVSCLDTLRPDQITVVLGFEPTRSGLKGKRVSTRNDALRRASFWLKISPLPDERPLQEHLEWLLNLFEPKHQVLSLISKQHSCELFCGFSSENGQGGACLGAELLAKLAGLGVPLVLTFPTCRSVFAIRVEKLSEGR